MGRQVYKRQPLSRDGKVMKVQALQRLSIWCPCTVLTVEVSQLTAGHVVATGAELPDAG